MAVSKLNPVAGGLDITKLTLRQTITSTGSVSYPAGVMQVFAVVIGGGGCGGLTGSGTPGGGGAGGVAFGWTFPSPYAVIGAGGGNNQSGSASMYGAIIAGGGAKGAPSGQSTANGSPGTVMNSSPYFLGEPDNTNGHIYAYNGSVGGAGSGAQNANVVGGYHNYIMTANSQNIRILYEAGLGGIYAPVGAGQRGSLNGGVNGNTNGLSGSGGTGSANQTANSTAGNGGPGYFAGGGGSCNGTGGATFFFAGGTTDTRADTRGGGGGAGALGAGGSTTNVNGGNGGSGGGGGGAAGGNGSGTAGTGGNGAVLLYW